MTFGSVASRTASSGLELSFFFTKSAGNPTSAGKVCFLKKSKAFFGECIAGWWLSPTPLKNHGVSSSVGMMKFPINMESHSKFHGSKPPTKYILYDIISQYFQNIIIIISQYNINIIYCNVISYIIYIYTYQFLHITNLYPD
jgi:hypothetical protein